MLMLRVLTPREVTIAPAKMDMLVMERTAPVNSKNSVLMKFNCRRAPLEIQQIEYMQRINRGYYMPACGYEFYLLVNTRR